MTEPVSILLLSNSRNDQSEFLDHVTDPTRQLVQDDEMVFIPFALADHDGYGQAVANALAPASIPVKVATPDERGAALISTATVLFVGGGNSFRLLKTMQRLGVMPTIQERFAAGELRYMGSSAGTNLACPTIRTTNDMPIVVPDGLEALGLTSFQINAHFQDDSAFEGHMGETRRTRLHEFLEENDVPVLALREGAWLQGPDPTALRLGGENGAILFQRGDTEVDELPLDTGTELATLDLGTARYDVGPTR